MSINYKGLVWAGIFLEDLNEGIEFYRDILGLNLLGQGKGYAHFDAGNGELLELFSGGTRSEVSKSERAQSIVVALRVTELDGAVAMLKRKGVVFTNNAGTFKNMRWATFIDREGNCIEIKEIN